MLVGCEVGLGPELPVGVCVRAEVGDAVGVGVGVSANVAEMVVAPLMFLMV